MAPRGVGTSHGSLDVSLCDLPQRVGVRHSLVSVDAVALHGVGGLGGCVARGHVGGRGGLHGPRVVQGLGLGAPLRVLSWTRGRVLGWGLVSSWGDGGLGLMALSRVVGKALGSVEALLLDLGVLSLGLELGCSRGAHGLGMRSPALADHPGPSLNHRVHRLSRVGGHGLQDLLLPVLLGAVLQVGLGVWGGHQRGSGCRGSSLEHGGCGASVVQPGTGDH